MYSKPTMNTQRKYRSR